jgi:flagellar biosynthesis protein FlhG
MTRRRLGRGLRDLGAVPFAREPAPTEPVPARPYPQAAGAPPRPAIVCVTSGKGGTGKSVMTSNLAVHLAASGVNILAVDADMGLANLHLLLGIKPARTVMEVIERGASLQEVAEIGPVGVRLAAGGSGMPEMADLHPERLRRLVLAMEDPGGRADVVLVDTGAGIGRATTSFLYALEQILVVTTPDVTAMTDGYAVIKNVARNNGTARLSLVVNRAASAVEGLEIFGRIDAVCRKFLSRSLLYLGHILDDPGVPASVSARIPILLNQPASPAAACFRGVGRALLLEIGQRRAAGAVTREPAQETGCA